MNDEELLEALVQVDRVVSVLGISYLQWAEIANKYTKELGGGDSMAGIVHRIIEDVALAVALSKNA